MHGCRDTGMGELIAIAQAFQLKHQKIRAQNCLQVRTSLNSLDKRSSDSVVLCTTGCRQDQTLHF